VDQTEHMEKPKTMRPRVIVFDSLNWSDNLATLKMSFDAQTFFD